MKYTSKEFDVYLYTDVYEAIKSMSIYQADTAYNNPNTGFVPVFLEGK